ncbi:DUF4212 domain-containing protein [Candidatus Chloroploca asiatica]|uniref:Sodium symporter small subunit domain-containing protein n=1 Tax=Candidatus Chloroploca asiatica TaxID=1506545 RepID=A0A2H3KIK6_9CHLR|nr:DUF4212 domain-containing protein [Candidatus Chloroploca asiatica]PDV96958.1 hypothetical protein A9Q02_05295 [Candidatus Chloroploca asiatica]
MASTRKVAVVEGGEEMAVAYWKANIRLIGILLGIWFFVSFIAGYLMAGIFNNISLGQVPLSFWIVQQGAIMTFVVLIFVYAVVMDRYDQRFNVHE